MQRVVRLAHGVEFLLQQLPGKELAVAARLKRLSQLFGVLLGERVGAVVDGAGRVCPREDVVGFVVQQRRGCPLTLKYFDERGRRSTTSATRRHDQNDGEGGLENVCKIFFIMMTPGPSRNPPNQVSPVKTPYRSSVPITVGTCICMLAAAKKKEETGWKSLMSAHAARMRFARRWCNNRRASAAVRRRP